MDFDAVLIDLPQLTVAELKELKLRIEALLYLSHDEAEEIEDWLLHGILEEVKDRGLAYTIPAFFKIKNNAHRGFARKSAALRLSLEQALPKKRKIDFFAFGRLCAELLADYLSESHMVSLSTMLNHVDELPQAIDKAFPGYMQSGYLHVLLKPAKRWAEDGEL